MPPSILIIEDNEDILANLYAYFEPLSYRLDCARNGQAGLEMALAGNFDCIILDVLLPGLDGLKLCHRLREEHGCLTPVIMLTALGTESDKVEGLECGADDYMVKPFSLRELEARIRSLLRRGGTNRKMEDGVYSFADLVVNRREHTASRHGRELKLAPAEFAILSELVRIAPRVVTRETLEEILWGDSTPCESALRTHIHELRRKLDKPFSIPLIHTVPHVGYRLWLNEKGSA